MFYYFSIYHVRGKTHLVTSGTTAPSTPCTILCRIQGVRVADTTKTYREGIDSSVDKLISCILNKTATTIIENTTTATLQEEDSEKMNNGYSHVKTVDEY